MVNHNAARLLKAARQLLIDKGWVQGSLHRAQGYCALGAYKVAAKRYGLATKSTAFRCLGESVKSGSLILENRITNYNDAQTRRKSQVIALFDRAIEKAKASR